MYFFYVRRYNDIDGLAPVAWKLHTYGEDVRVYQYHGGEWDNDYRLNYLRKQGIPVLHTVDFSEIKVGTGQPLAAITEYTNPSFLPVELKKIAVAAGINSYTDGKGSAKRIRDLQAFNDFIMIEDIGSPKYCSEWMDIHDTIYPRAELPNTGRLKVAWNTSDGGGGLNQQLFRETHDWLSRNVDLVSRHNVYGTNLVNPSDIIDWCDVHLTTTSCYTPEAVIKGKINYHLRYCHNRGTIYEDSRVFHQVNSLDELKGMLASPTKNGDSEEWLIKHIYAYKKNRDVLNEYFERIAGNARVDRFCK